MRVLFLHEIRLPVAKSHRYNIEIRSPACRMAHGDPRYHGKEETYPGSGVSAERMKTLAFPAVATRIIIRPFHETSCLVFHDSGFCMFLLQSRIIANSDAILIAIIRILRCYDLMASHFFFAFNLLPSALMAVINRMLFRTLLSIIAIRQLNIYMA